MLLLVIASGPVWLLSPLSAARAQPTTADPSPLAAGAAIAAVAVLLTAFVGLLFFVMWRERRATRLRRKLSAARSA